MEKKIFIIVLMFGWLTSVFAFIQNIDNPTNVLHLLNYESNIIQKDDKLYFVSDNSIDEFQIQADGSLNFVKFIQKTGYSSCKPLIKGDSLYVIERSIDETIPDSLKTNYLQIINIGGDEMELSQEIQLCSGYQVLNLQNYNNFLIYNLNWDPFDHVYDLTTQQEIATYAFGEFCEVKDSLLFSALYSTQLDSTKIEIRDISDIMNPQMISVITFSPSLETINYKFAGDILYVFGVGAIKILDISDIENPIVLGEISNVPEGNSAYEHFLGVEVYNNYLIFNDKNNNFWVYNISDLSNPQFLQYYGNFQYYKSKPGFYICNNGFMYEIDATNQLCQIDLSFMPEISIVNHIGLTGEIMSMNFYNNWEIFRVFSGIYALNTLGGNAEPICLLNNSNNYSSHFDEKSVGIGSYYITSIDSLIIIDYNSKLSIFSFDENSIDLKNQISIEAGHSQISRVDQYLFLTYFNNGQIKVYTIDEAYNLDEVADFTKGNKIYLAQRMNHYNLPYIPTIMEENYSRYLCLLQNNPPFNEYSRIPITKLSINFLENDDIITAETDYSSKFGTFTLPDQINFFNDTYDCAFKLHNEYLFKLDTINLCENDGHAEFYSFLNHNYEELFDYDFNPNIINAFLSEDHESLYSIHRYNIYKYDCDYVPNDDEVVPQTNNYTLSNYPNPFHSISKRGLGTTISFDLPKSGDVDLTIYNIKGQKVKTLTNEKYPKGKHSLIWNGKNDKNQDVSSGVYFYKLNVDGKDVNVKKCLLMK